MFDGKIERGSVCAGLSATHNYLNQSHLIGPMVAPPRRFATLLSHSNIAAIVEIAFPSSRLFTNTNVRRFGPAAFPSSINAR
jgi:hypothetical protein